MELEDMLEELCKISKLTSQTELTDSNVDKVKAYFMQRWEEVLRHYEEQLSAGKQYYEEVLQGSNTAVAIDIGWAGSGAIALDYLINEEWKLGCPVTGIIAGTNTCHNAEPNASETFLQSGKLVSYLYSQRENRDLWKFHDAGKNHNLYWEMLLDSPVGSFRGFYMNEDGKCECQFKEGPVNKTEIEEVQRGILEFVGQYERVQRGEEAFSLVGGRDAYAPVMSVLQKGNRSFRNTISDLVDEMGI